MPDSIHGASSIITSVTFAAASNRQQVESVLAAPRTRKACLIAAQPAARSSGARKAQKAGTSRPARRAARRAQRMESCIVGMRARRWGGYAGCLPDCAGLGAHLPRHISCTHLDVASGYCGSTASGRPVIAWVRGLAGAAGPQGVKEVLWTRFLHSVCGLVAAWTMASSAILKRGKTGRPWPRPSAGPVEGPTGVMRRHTPGKGGPRV
jgi:hypothetical protein